MGFEQVGNFVPFGLDFGQGIFEIVRHGIKVGLKLGNFIAAADFHTCGIVALLKFAGCLCQGFEAANHASRVEIGGQRRRWQNTDQGRGQANGRDAQKGNDGQNQAVRKGGDDGFFREITIGIKCNGYSPKDRYRCSSNHNHAELGMHHSPEQFAFTKVFPVEPDIEQRAKSNISG